MTSRLEYMDMSRIKFTPEGGLAIRLVTASSISKGTIMAASRLADGQVIPQTAEYDVVGVAYHDAIAGEYVWIVINGIAEMLLEDGTIAESGNWVVASAVDGRANASQPAPPNESTIAAQQEHFKEVGHCLETKAAGTDVLVKCIIHLN